MDRFKWLFLFLSIAGCSAAHAEPAIKGATSELHCYFVSGKKVCSFLIKFAGAIDATSVNEVASLLDPEPARAELLGKTFSINSPGGNLDAAMAIGRLLRRNRMSILIPKDGECVSACVIIYAGAVSRFYRGKIGIHRPYLNQSIGSQLQAPDKLRSNYEQMLKTLRAYLRDMNVSERLAEDMLKIAPADVRYLSNDDLNSYGLTYNDPVEQETIDLQEAQSMGLDRQEHIRRQALANAKCGALIDPKLDFLVVLDCREEVMKSGR